MVTLIGIGLGGSGQFLGRDEIGRYHIVDNNTQQSIKLSNPRGLLAILQKELNEAESCDL